MIILGLPFGKSIFIYEFHLSGGQNEFLRKESRRIQEIWGFGGRVSEKEQHVKCGVWSKLLI